MDRANCLAKGKRARPREIPKYHTSMPCYEASGFWMGEYERERSRN